MDLLYLRAFQGYNNVIQILCAVDFHGGLPQFLLKFTYFNRTLFKYNMYLTFGALELEILKKKRAKSIKRALHVFWSGSSCMSLILIYRNCLESDPSGFMMIKHKTFDQAKYCQTHTKLCIYYIAKSIATPSFTCT